MPFFDTEEEKPLLVCLGIIKNNIPRTNKLAKLALGQ
jgi:hypothetical protein